MAFGFGFVTYRVQERNPPPPPAPPPAALAGFDRVLLAGALALFRDGQEADKKKENCVFARTRTTEIPVHWDAGSHQWNHRGAVWLCLLRCFVFLLFFFFCNIPVMLMIPRPRSPSLACFCFYLLCHFVCVLFFFVQGNGDKAWASRISAQEDGRRADSGMFFWGGRGGGRGGRGGGRGSGPSGVRALNTGWGRGKG